MQLMTCMSIMEFYFVIIYNSIQNYPVFNLRYLTCDRKKNQSFMYNDNVENFRSTKTYFSNNGLLFEFYYISRLNN